MGHSGMGCIGCCCECDIGISYATLDIAASATLVFARTMTWRDGLHWYFGLTRRIAEPIFLEQDTKSSSRHNLANPSNLKNQ